MKRKRKRYPIFRTPGFGLISMSYAVGLALLAGLISAAVLGVWTTPQRLAVAIMASALVAYALYGTAYRFHIIERLEAYVRRSERLSRFLDSYNYRTVLYACGSILLEVIFAALGIAAGIMTGSDWFRISGIYYLILAALRSFIVLYGARGCARHKQEDVRAKIYIRTYTVTGVSLLLFGSVLSVLFDVMVANDSLFVKSELMIYVTAIFAFYKTLLAIVGFFKSRKNDNLIVRSLRSVSAVSAAVSFLIFMTSLVATFPDAQGFSTINGILISYTHTATLAIAIAMIVVASKRRKRLKAKSAKEHMRT